ncbi:MAG: hypothetical protein PWP51_781 [Clostridiales bacterium]|nr:hypothetical protein [Clostridiales bacterium]MDN5298228.1 hypothetical protein [Clostridiales bacterium]
MGLTYTEISFGAYLRDKLEAYYNLFDEAPMACDFMAVYNQRNAAFALKKEFEYYAFENNEVILYTECDDMQSVDIDILSAQIDATHHEMVGRNEDHMSSSIYLVYTVKAFPDEEMIKKIKRFRYYKSFRWGLEGWLNVGLIVINEVSGEGISNRFGKKEMKRLLNLFGKFKQN